MKYKSAIVAAGSLLGVSMAAGDSFPVGKVDHMMLYPLTFKEYLSMVDEAMYDLLSNRQVGDAIVTTLEERIKRHFADYRKAWPAEGSETRPCSHNPHLHHVPGDAGLGAVLL